MVRVTASDAPVESARPGAQLFARERSISDRQHRPRDHRTCRGTPAGNQIEVRFHAKDALSALGKAEYSVNGGDWMVVEP